MTPVAHEQSSAVRPGAHILVVDDEAPQMRALCDTLESEGYRATGFSSSAQALQGLRAGDHEVLLTDLMMPEMDGIALIKAARKVDPDLAGIVMTGHGTIDTAVAAMQVGALDYVLKPFKLNAILTVLNRALNIRALRIENALLQKREREQAEELALAYADLESFSYSVSHDLRSPLRAIRGYADICVSEFSETLPEEGAAYLGKVVAGAERMDRLIGDLLKFCRFSRAQLQKVEIDMQRMVKRILIEQQEREEGRQIEIRVDELPPCSGDPSLIEQVWVNLISNALKFTRKRKIAYIEIGTQAASTQDAVAAKPVYYIRDNGSGFDMKYIDRLFGVFQRLHSGDQFEGTGVGLSIVRRVLQRHGGAIRAESVLDEGTAFYFQV